MPVVSDGPLCIMYSLLSVFMDFFRNIEPTLSGDIRQMFVFRTAFLILFEFHVEFRVLMSGVFIDTYCFWHDKTEQSCKGCHPRWSEVLGVTASAHVH